MTKSASPATLPSTCLAKTLAPEEIRTGDYVTLLRVSCEFPSFFWFDQLMLAPHEPIRIEFVPDDSGTPLKVAAICLPFVLVRTPFGKSRSLDVRRDRLARLDQAYGRFAWKSFKKTGLR